MTKLENQFFETKKGDVNLYAMQDGGQFIIAGEFQGEIIAFLRATEDKPYNQLTRTFVRSDFRRLGIMSNILGWCRENGIPLISDTQMTDDSVALWKALEKYGMPKIINIETDKKYNIKDAPFHPEQDNAKDYRYSKKQPDGQRWFYILEGVNKNRLVEHIEHRVWMPLTPKHWFDGGP